MGISVPEYFADPANAVQLTEGTAWLADILTALGKTGMAVGALIALVLDNTIPGTPEERGLDRFVRSFG